MTCQQVAGGYKCTPGAVTFTAGYDPSNPLVSHNWKLGGTQASTASAFTQNFPAIGNYTVEHTGSNSCGGNCTQTQQLEIASTITPPPSGAPAAPASSAGLIVGIAAIGLLAVVVMRQK